MKKGKVKLNRQKARETARKEIDDLILIDPTQEMRGTVIWKHRP